MTWVENNIFLFVLFLHQHLYSAMILQPISLLINAYGHYRWTHPRDDERSAADSNRLKVGNIPPKHVALYVLAVLGSAALWAFVLKYVFDNPTNPGLDSLMLMLTLCAQYLSARKYWECWIVWLLVNAGNATLYILSGLYIMPVVSALYIANGIWSLVSWRKMYKKNE